MPSLTRSSEPAAAMTRGADDILGDLNADGAEIAAGAHDQHGLARFSSATCTRRFHAVGTWRMTTAA